MKAIFKAFIVSFLGMFLHEALVAKKGEKLFHDHATILDVSETTVVSEVNIGDGFKYKITVEHVKENEDFA